MLQSESINLKRIWKGLSHTSNFMADTASPSRGLKTWPERPGAGPEKGSGVADWKYVMSLIVFVFLFSFLSSPAAHAEAAITFSLDAQVGTGAINPDSDNPTAIIYRSGNLTVSGAKNYQIITSASDTELKNDTGVVLPALTEEKTLTSMPVNHWGLTILDRATDNTDIPTESSRYNSPNQSLDPESISGDVARKLTFGVAAKVDKTQASGIYRGATLTISILAEDAASGPTMQDMTPNDCKNIPEGDTANFVDSRDGKSYIVGKLKDGKCWMLQNLALGTTSGKIKLTSSDTNITTDYELPQATTTGTFSSSDYSKAEVGIGSHTDNSYSNSTRTDNGNGTFSGNTGNFYSWTAATAGAGADRTGNLATGNYNVDNSDICPKGWQLPSGGDMNTTKGTSGAKTDFERLIKSYFTTWQPSSATASFTKSNFSSDTTTWDNTHWFAAVGYFVNGAYSTSSDGAWWSRTVYSATRAFVLDENSSSLYPAHNYARYLGYSVRCVFTS